MKRAAIPVLVLCMVAATAVARPYSNDGNTENWAGDASEDSIPPCLGPIPVDACADLLDPADSILPIVIIDKALPGGSDLVVMVVTGSSWGAIKALYGAGRGEAIWSY